MRVTAEIHAQLEALVERGLRLGEEVGGFIIVPGGGTGVGSQFIECENVAPPSERYHSFSYSDDVWERIVAVALGRGDYPVPFHTHNRFASRLSAEDEVFMPESPKVIHGEEGFCAYVWSSELGQYEAAALEIAEPDSWR